MYCAIDEENVQQVLADFECPSIKGMPKGRRRTGQASYVSLGRFKITLHGNRSLLYVYTEVRTTITRIYRDVNN